MRSADAVEPEARADGVVLTPRDGGWSAAAVVYLADRPGSLAHLARDVAERGANITRFLFDRSASPNRIEITVESRLAAGVGALLDNFSRHGHLEPLAEEQAVGIVDPAGVLTLKVQLVDEPGTLASYAELLAAHDANVIFMSYNSVEAPGQCEMSMAAPSAEEASALLAELAQAGYPFSVEYRGSDPEAYDHIIGLSAVEVFFLRLRETLPERQRAKLRALVDSSEQCRRSLVQFRSEGNSSGEALAAAEVFENILHLATMSLRKVGPHFALCSIGPIPVSERCEMTWLAAPTGGIGCLVSRDGGRELIAIDTGYGLYYDDWRQWVGRLGFDLSCLTSVLLTHADTDHAGFSGALQRDLSVAVFAHPAVERIIAEGNRAAGSSSRLGTLNRHFTQLVNAFTEACHPESVSLFEPADGDIGGFAPIGQFRFADLAFDVLESLGGHVPGQVFLLEQRAGLLFTGDYLIDFRSLTDHEKALLSVPKYLMVSTNHDSGVFRTELDMLRRLAIELDERLAPTGVGMRVIPGHGDMYRVDEAHAIGVW